MVQQPISGKQRALLSGVTVVAAFAILAAGIFIGRVPAADAPKIEAVPTGAQPSATPSESPSIARLAPSTGFPGSALLVSVIGAGLDQVWKLEFEPPDGIVIQGDPMPSKLGTMLTVPITLKPDAPAGKRNVVATNRAGQRSTAVPTSLFVVTKPSVNGLSTDNLARRAGSKPVVSVVNPTGSGSRDPAVLIDGELESSCCGQFDTFDGTGQPAAFVGFEGNDTLRFNAFEYQVGLLTREGGWFQSGTSRLEVKTDAGWSTVSDVFWESGPPEAPNGDGGRPLASFAVLTAKFPTVVGTGMRIAGVPSAGTGTAGYISSGEVAAYYRDVPIVGTTDWTMYRSDVTHSGQAPDDPTISKTSVTRLQEKWSTGLTQNVPITQSGVFATPVVSDGIVFAGTMDGWIHALSLDSGREIWKRFTSLRNENSLGENGVVATPAISGDTLYVAADDASIWALDSKTGEVRWHTPLAIDRFDAGYASPMVVDDRLIVAVANGVSDQPCSVGKVVSLQRSDGKVLWTTYTTLRDRPGSGVWATPAIDLQKNRVYIATGSTCFPSNAPVEGLYYDSLIGLNLSDGSVQWVYQHILNDNDDLDFGSSPVMFEERVAAVSKSGSLVAVNQLTGAFAWQTVIASRNATPYDGGGVNSPSYAEGRIFTGGGPINGPPDSQAINYRGSFVAVDAVDGHVIWRQPLASAPLGASAVLNGMVFVGDGSSLAVFDAATGQVLHRIMNKTLVWGAVSIARGCVLVGDISGYVHCYSIDGS